MSDEKKKRYEEADLSVFPPYMGRFVFTILLLVLSHVCFMLLMGLFLLELEITPTLVVGFISALIIIFSNIAITRGHSIFVNVLKVMSGTYIFIGLLALALELLSIKHSSIELSLISIIFSSFALLIMESSGYKVCVDFVKKRWDIYRETGETVAEVIAKNRKASGN